MLQMMNNTALEDWFARHRTELPRSFDTVYVNGDHTLNAMRLPNETWTAQTTEPLFRELMFEGGAR